MKKQFRFIVISILILIGTVLFTNCQQIQSTSSPAPLPESLKSNNNGYSYGGKIEGDYARLIPHFNCAGGPAPAATFAIKEQEYILRDYIQDGCSTTSTPVMQDQFEFSNLQSKVFGYKNIIFERLDQKFTEVPDRLIETWCKAEISDGQSVELISYYKRSIGASETDVLFSNPSIPGDYIKQLESYRVQTADGIDIRSKDEFILKVHRNQLDERGRYLADLKIMINFEEKVAQANCRFGGTLDSHIWPLKPLVTTSFNRAEVAPNGHWALLSRQQPGSTNLELHAVDILKKETKTNLVDASILSPFYGIDSNSSFGHFLNYQGLQHYDFNTKTKTTLFTKPHSSSVISSNYFFDEDRKFAYFSHYSMVPTQNIQVVKLNLQNGQAQGIGPVYQSGISDLAFNSKFQKIAYLCCNVPQNGRYKNNLYVHDLLSGKINELALPGSLAADYPYIEFLKRSEDLFAKRKDIQFDVIKATSSDFAKPIKYFLFDLSSENLVELPAGVSFNTKLIELDEMILVPVYRDRSVNSLAVYNQSNKNFVSVPNIEKPNSPYKKEQVLSLDGQIFTAGKNEKQQLQFLRYSLINGTTKTICSDRSFDDFVFNQDISGNTVHAVIREGYNLSLIAIDLVKEQCRTLNKLPLGFKEISVAENSSLSVINTVRWLSDFRMNDEKSHIALKFQSSTFDLRFEDELYLIPINGRSSNRLNFPNVNAGQISDFGFVKGQSSMYFWGGQKSQAQHFIYAFDF